MIAQRHPGISVSVHGPIWPLVSNAQWSGTPREVCCEPQGEKGESEGGTMILVTGASGFVRCVFPRNCFSVLRVTCGAGEIPVRTGIVWRYVLISSQWQPGGRIVTIYAIPCRRKVSLRHALRGVAMAGRARAADVGVIERGGKPRGGDMATCTIRSC